MKILKTISEIRVFLREKRRLGRSIGLVPTMGALHDGHLSLLKASVEENDISVVSIFVNPTQFNNQEDFEKYPLHIEEDLEKLSKNKCDVVFLPDQGEIYRDKTRLKFHFGSLEKVMEGKFRPGHFNGVAIIVSKLFNIIQPDTAYFGQKDLQQFTIIKLLNEQLDFGIKLRCMPIMREPNGLAMSSRNLRLSSAGIETASIIYKIINKSAELLLTGNSISNVKSFVENEFKNSEARLEYFEIVSLIDMKSIRKIKSGEECALCIAAYVEDVRLIDNTLLTL
ncbi:MAG: pantoate--beta-alanine ligase [Cyclobacteriaceae bacterium]|nr:pantoate--beta-alanine ligase [Cyclobacteriaceae bacterium]